MIRVTLPDPVAPLTRRESYIANKGYSIDSSLILLIDILDLTHNVPPLAALPDDNKALADFVANSSHQRQCG
jgi:hypothetical protein